MPGQEYKIKNRENVMDCYNKHWVCGDYSCPLYEYCHMGLIGSVTDFEIELMFKEVI